MSGEIVRWQPKDMEKSLDQRADRLGQLLMGTGVDPERFVGMTVQALARQPSLLQCTQESVLLAVLSVAELGLVPNGPYGGAWLVPYGREAKWIIDWRGMLKLAYRSGILKDAYAEVRYSSEPFVVHKGTNPRIEHEYGLVRPTEDAVTHFYAVAHLRTGGHVQHVMTALEVEAIRNRQRNWQKGPWASDPLEMGRKTVVRNLFKYVPEAMTPQLAAALDHEDSLDTLEPVPVRVPTGRQARLLAAVGATETASEAGAGQNGDTATDGQSADQGAAPEGTPADDPDLPPA